MRVGGRLYRQALNTYAGWGAPAVKIQNAIYVKSVTIYCVLLQEVVVKRE